MSTELAEEAVAIAKRALDDFAIRGEKLDLCQQLVDEFDRRHGGDWHCISGHGFEWRIKYYDENYVSFRLYSTLIVLFKTASV